MIIFRAVAVLGLILLAAVGVFAIYISVLDGEWVGVLMGFAFFALLAFLFDALRAEASRGSPFARTPNKTIFLTFLFACGLMLAIGGVNNLLAARWLAAAIKLLMAGTMLCAVVAECYLAYRNRA